MTGGYAPWGSNIQARISTSSARFPRAAAPMCWCVILLKSCVPITGRTVMVENRAGAGGNIATEYIGRSKPDGYTIFVHAGNTLAARRS